MRSNGKIVMSACLMVIGAYAVITALKWPLRTAIFPTVIGIPVFFMALVELLLNLFGKEETEKKQSAVDFELSEGLEPALATRRTLSSFIWIIGFFLAIIFFGFQIAAPLFVLCFLRLHGKENWPLSLLMSAAAWGVLYGLFIRLLEVPFKNGLILRALGIG